RGETQSRDVLLSSTESERRGGDLNDVGPAVGVEQIGAPQVMQKGLAVVTIAEDAVHRPRSGVGHASLDLSAATAQLGLLAHTGCPRGPSADRCTGATDGVAGRPTRCPPLASRRRAL